MFLGHFAVAFSAKKIAPSVSLGTLFLAAQFVDLLWPALLLLGIERVAIVPGITRITPIAQGCGRRRARGRQSLHHRHDRHMVIRAVEMAVMQRVCTQV